MRDWKLFTERIPDLAGKFIEQVLKHSSGDRNLMGFGAFCLVAGVAMALIGDGAVAGFGMGLCALSVVGTFAGWFYLAVKRPEQLGDREERVEVRRLEHEGAMQQRTIDAKLRLAELLRDGALPADVVQQLASQFSMMQHLPVDPNAGERKPSAPGLVTEDEDE